jgi:tryptophan 2,3-dioxygenase
VTNELTYNDYLRLDELLDLQTPQQLPEHPDELHFIVTHQALELWFKLMKHDVRRARSAIVERRWSAAAIVLKRLSSITATGIEQMRTLQDLPVGAFLGFRRALGTASGLQSLQFRELEVIGGIRDPEYLKMLHRMNGSVLPEAIAAALKELSLAEAFEQAAREAGVSDWAELYRMPESFGPIYTVAELLVDYDEQWYRWRCAHVAIVARSIGMLSRGTAGTTHSYLDSTLRLRFFPYLWDARFALTQRSDSAAS